MRASAFVFAAVSLISHVSATIYVTSPVASTVCPAGSPCPVQWNDDGNQPALATIGACEIDLCTGGVTQQTCLQNISPSLDVSQNSQVTYTVNPTIGANDVPGNPTVWFIKFTSLAYKDPTNPTFPYVSFSAKFALSGMTGTFNSTILGQLSSLSTAPAASVAASTTPAATAASSAMVTTKASAAATTAAKATTTAAKSGASNVVSSLSLTGGLVALVVGAAALF